MQAAQLTLTRVEPDVLKPGPRLTIETASRHARVPRRELRTPFWQGLERSVA